MLNLIKNTAIRLRSDEKGATLVEYGIALSLAIALGGGALLTLGNDVSATYGSASSALPTQAPTP
ncbi:MAG: hypothetical protein WBG95_14400 [Sulfitobacter sp.]